MKTPPVKREPTDNERYLMREALMANQWEDAVAFIDNGAAWTVRNSCLAPNSKAAKIIASGLCMRRCDLVAPPADEFPLTPAQIASTKRLEQESQLRAAQAYALQAQAQQNALTSAGFFGISRAEKPFRQELQGERFDAAAARRDPYAEHSRLERERNYAGLTAEHPDNIRARKIAALRESLSAKVEPRYPHEGRSDRVYRVNER
jgi:hypothetical protein